MKGNTSEGTHETQGQPPVDPVEAGFAELRQALVARDECLRRAQPRDGLASREFRLRLLRIINETSPDQAPE